jgi:hypothetical protein
MSKREFSFVNVRPSRIAKKTVSYCNTSDSELEFGEDGYERSKTKSFKKKANATNSNSDEFKLGPEAYTSDSDEFELDPEADTVLSEIELEDEEMIGLKRKKNSNVQTQTHKYTGYPIAAAKPSAAIKSSVGVDEQKLAAKPYTTGVVVELTDEEQRATNKKIKEEVFKTFLNLRLCWVCLKPLVQSIGKYSFLKWRMVVIISISCSLASTELFETGGPKPL